MLQASMRKSSLVETYPQLASQWHPTKNGLLKPEDVTAGSNKKAWWLCDKGHEWESIVNNRTKGQGCPYCGNKKVDINNCLEATNPDIAKQWHPTKNGELSPKQVTAGSNKYAWWICDRGHEYYTKISHRTFGSKCPACYGKKLSKERSLAYKRPDLAKEFHPSKNGSLGPDDIHCSSRKKYWWQCLIDPDHVWQSTADNRNKGNGCPFCTNRGGLVAKGKSLGDLNPHLIDEWDFKQNEKTPYDYAPYSNKRVFWICTTNKLHTWKTAICKRVEGTGCPYCNQGWTVEKIRLFISDLLKHINALSEAELYVLCQQNGLLDMAANSKSKAFVQAFKTGKFPKDELEKFINKQPSLVDDFINDSQKILEDDCLEEDLSSASHALSEDNIEVEGPLKIVATKDVLKSLNSNIFANLDEEAVDFFITSAVAKIWQHAFIDEEAAITQFNEMCNEDNQYVQEVRNRFTCSFNALKSLEIPEGYAFNYEPNLMQRYSAYLVKSKKRVGNWSGTGAGKTLSAILASRVINAQLTLIFCPNNTIDNWQRRIKETYPKSSVYCKNEGLQEMLLSEYFFDPKYLLLNYEFFQQPKAVTFLQQLLNRYKIDFIVIDEIHFSKQREEKQLTLRKQTIEACLAEAAKRNKDLHVLGMSATPVINSLYEGKVLIELVTGFQHDEIKTKPTIQNCISLYQKLMLHGIRCLPAYDIKMNLHIEYIDCLAFFSDIKKSLDKVADLEAVLVKAKTRYILENLKPKTIIYTHYLQKIVEPLRAAIEQCGWKTGLFTGTEKDGLRQFVDGDIDILLASSCAGTGIDGLQRVCNRLIIVCMPWTHAEFEQLKGRIYRQGQLKESVDILVPLTYANINGERWSWCESRWKRILFKKSISDAAVDGVIPEGHLRTKEQAFNDAKQWLERIERGEIYEAKRRLLDAQLPGYQKSKSLRKVGDITRMNQKINKFTSSEAHKYFTEHSEEWYDYHALYKEVRQDWEVIPYKEAIEWVKARPGIIVADFGCGEALLAETVANTVYSFDHIAISDKAVACDMSHVSLKDGSIDAAIFSLSLMGTNFVDYLREAHRCLRLDGQIWIAEPTDRIKNSEQFKRLLECLGFNIIDMSEKWKFTFARALKSEREINEVLLNELLKEREFDIKE